MKELWGKDKIIREYGHSCPCFALLAFDTRNTEND